MNLFKVIAH